MSLMPCTEPEVLRRMLVFLRRENVLGFYKYQGLHPYMRPIHLCVSSTTEAWKHADWTEDFIDIEGDRKERPHLQVAHCLCEGRVFNISLNRH